MDGFGDVAVMKSRIKLILSIIKAIFPFCKRSREKNFFTDWSKIVRKSKR